MYGADGLEEFMGEEDGFADSKEPRTRTEKRKPNMTKDSTTVSSFESAKAFFTAPVDVAPAVVAAALPESDEAAMERALAEASDDESHPRGRSTGQSALLAATAASSADVGAKSLSDVQSPTTTGLQDRLDVGEAVEARFGGKSRWFPGKITAWNPATTTYSIGYDDGDAESAVVRLRIRRPGDKEVRTLAAGMSVDVRLERKGKGYHAAVVAKVDDTDCSCRVLFQDGDSEPGVTRDYIIGPCIPPAAAAAAAAPAAAGADLVAAPTAAALAANVEPGAAVAVKDTSNDSSAAAAGAAATPALDANVSQAVDAAATTKPADGAVSTPAGIDWIKSIASTIPPPSAAPPAAPMALLAPSTAPEATARGSTWPGVGPVPPFAMSLSMTGGSGDYSIDGVGQTRMASTAAALFAGPSAGKPSTLDYLALTTPRAEEADGDVQEAVGPDLQPPHVPAEPVGVIQAQEPSSESTTRSAAAPAAVRNASFVPASAASRTTPQSQQEQPLPPPPLPQQNAAVMEAVQRSFAAEAIALAEELRLVKAQLAAERERHASELNARETSLRHAHRQAMAAAAAAAAAAATTAAAEANRLVVGLRARCEATEAKLAKQNAAHARALEASRREAADAKALLLRRDEQERLRTAARLRAEQQERRRVVAAGPSPSAKAALLAAANGRNVAGKRGSPSMTNSQATSGHRSTGTGIMNKSSSERYLDAAAGAVAGELLSDAPEVEYRTRSPSPPQSEPGGGRAKLSSSSLSSEARLRNDSAAAVVVAAASEAALCKAAERERELLELLHERDRSTERILAQMKKKVDIAAADCSRRAARAEAAVADAEQRARRDALAFYAKKLGKTEANVF